MRGSFETWNLQMKSFALSDGGYDLLLTPKDQPDSTLGSDKYELLHPKQFGSMLVVFQKTIEAKAKSTGTVLRRAECL